MRRKEAWQLANLELAPSLKKCPDMVTAPHRLNYHSDKADSFRVSMMCQSNILCLAAHLATRMYTMTT